MPLRVENTYKTAAWSLLEWPAKQTSGRGELGTEGTSRLLLFRAPPLSLPPLPPPRLCLPGRLLTNAQIPGHSSACRMDQGKYVDIHDLLLLSDDRGSCARVFGEESKAILGLNSLQTRRHFDLKVLIYRTD